MAGKTTLSKVSVTYSTRSMLRILLAGTTTLALFSVGKLTECCSVVLGRLGNATTSLAASASRSRDEFWRLVVTPNEFGGWGGTKDLGVFGGVGRLGHRG